MYSRLLGFFVILIILNIPVLADPVIIPPGGEVYLGEEGLDIHSYTASLMFGKEYTPDFKKKYPELRQMAKPIGFGLMYGMGAAGLMGRIKAETGKDIPQTESQHSCRWRSFRAGLFRGLPWC